MDPGLVSEISVHMYVLKVVFYFQENKTDGAKETLIKQQIHKPKQISQQQQDIKMWQQLQQRKQKQQELAALNAKLKSLSKPVSQTKTQDNLPSLNKERVARESPSDGNSSEEDEVKERTVLSAQQAKVIPQRKVASLTTRSPTKVKQPKSDSRNEGTAVAGGNSKQDELACLQRVISFSDSESDEESDNKSETDESDKNETNQSEEEENDSFVVRNIHVHAKNHDTNDRNNNENIAFETNTIAVENNNRNNRTSVTTGSESSRSSNVLEVHSHSNSDRGPSPVSNNLSSSAGSGTLKFGTHNGGTEYHENATNINGMEEVKPHASDGESLKCAIRV